jgi:uncharacterized damage-inducible protein DinB
LISVEYCRLLARHNRWMNERMYAAASAMTDEERKRDSRAFFGSLHRTLNHILWGDSVWLGRFLDEPFAVPAYGADMHADFADLAREREATDVKILDWAGKLAPAWLEGTFTYRRSSDGVKCALPAWIVATHLFAHAVHHRGQVSTLLKQAGHDIGPTDLPYLPGVMRVLD